MMQKRLHYLVKTFAKLNKAIISHTQNSRTFLEHVFFPSVMWLLKCHVEGKGEEDGSVVWTSNASIIQQRLKSRVFCQALPSWDSKHYIKKWETGQATVVLQKCLWCKISLLKIISLHCPRAYRSAFVHHGVECYLFSLRLMFNLYFHTQAYIQGLEH